METENISAIKEPFEPKKKNTVFWKVFMIIIAVMGLLIIISLFQKPLNTQSLILRDGMTLTESDCNNFPGNYLFYSLSCPNCIDVLKELNNSNYNISFMNIENNNTLSFLLDKNVVISAIPTLIANCKVLIGEKDLNIYNQTLS